MKIVYQAIFVVLSVIFTFSGASAQSIPNGRWILTNMPFNSGPLKAIQEGFTVPYFVLLDSQEDLIKFTFVRIYSNFCGPGMECGQLVSPLTLTIGRKFLSDKLSVKSHKIEARMIVDRKDIDVRHVFEPWIAFFEGSRVSDITSSSFVLTSGSIRAQFASGDEYTLEAATVILRLAKVSFLKSGFCVLEQILSAFDQPSSSPSNEVFALADAALRSHPATGDEVDLGEMFDSTGKIKSPRHLLKDQQAFYWIEDWKKKASTELANELDDLVCHNLMLLRKQYNPRAGYEPKLNKFVVGFRDFSVVPDAEAAIQQAEETGATLTIVKLKSARDATPTEDEVVISIWTGLSNYAARKILAELSSWGSHEMEVGGYEWYVFKGGKEGSVNSYAQVFEGRIVINIASTDLQLVKEAAESINISGLLSFQP